jgi:phospholipid/cholesterol/gamma-HCH transport system substrate-binding protein
VKLAIRKHWRDFVAIIGLLVLSGGVALFILDNQRLAAPGWVPVLGKTFYEFDAEFSNAQAVTPGQGQTVNVAGVPVGDIARVRLENGKAIVGLRIDRQKAPDLAVYKDATMLLRPKTGLKDMAVQLEPGTPAAGPLPEGGRIPVGQTQPDVNLDEVLSALDTDTRSYLQILVGDGSEGLRGRKKDLGDTFRRFEPLGRDLRKVNTALARRRTNIKRVIHNFSLLVEELGGKDDQIAELVDSSNAVFAAFAEQEADIRATVRELPTALTETRTALEKAGTLAAELGPAAEALRPSARALGPALRDVRPFLRTTTPIIRDQLRPLTRAALPVTAELRPALRDLSAISPDLRETFTILNRALDMIAYNPPGEEEGFLFWMSWVNHLGASIFNTQDAHGPVRRGLFIANCNALDIVDNVAQANPALSVIVTLLNPVRNSALCPKPTPTVRAAMAAKAGQVPVGTGEPVHARPAGKVLSSTWTQKKGG